MTPEVVFLDVYTPQQMAELRFMSTLGSKCWCGSGRMYHDCCEQDDRLAAMPGKRERRKVDWSRFGF